MKIAIVEDEGITALFLKETVEDFGHSVIGMFDESNTLLDCLNSDDDIDLVLMDIKINGKLDGLQLAKKLCIEYPSISIVFITSFKDSDTIKDAKDASPLGYLIKPVMESDVEAVLMVVESFNKNHNFEDSNLVNVGKYVYDKTNKTLLLNGEMIQLSQKETICIDILAKNKNSYVSHEQLIINIWDGENNREVSLRELMYRLRKKLPYLNLKNVPKMGYFLSE